MNILIQANEKKEKHKRDNLNFNKRRKKVDFSQLKSVLIYAAEILLVIFFAYLLVRGFGIRTQNIGQSMEPTIGSNDYVLVNRFIYKIKKPKRGDIVVFDPKDSHSSISIKRVVGIPGDKILIKEGVLFVNDKAYTEKTKVDMMDSGGIAEKEIKLKEDEYFLLGDNRNNSEDSRFDSVGNVSRADIKGKVWLDISSGHFGLL